MLLYDDTVFGGTALRFFGIGMCMLPGLSECFVLEVESELDEVLDPHPSDQTGMYRYVQVCASM